MRIRSPPGGTVNVLREHLDVFDRCGGKDAVAEIEDMSGSASHAFQNVLGLIEHTPRWAEQQRRIEVPLNGTVEADVFPRFVNRHTPVHTDDIAAPFTQLLEHRRGAGPEMDDWH